MFGVSLTFLSSPLLRFVDAAIEKGEEQSLMGNSLMGRERGELIKGWAENDEDCWEDAKEMGLRKENMDGACGARSEVEVEKCKEILVGTMLTNICTGCDSVL